MHTIDAIGQCLVVVYTWRADVVRLISARKATPRERPSMKASGELMKKEYDFSRGKRGPVIDTLGRKKRITIRLDDDLLQWFRDRADEHGGGNYQTMINAALREYVEDTREDLKTTLRSVVREEFAKYRRRAR